MRELYKRTGLEVSRQTLFKWESQRSEPFLSAVSQLAEFFGKDLSFFLDQKSTKIDGIKQERGRTKND